MVHITNGDAVGERLRRWAGEPRLIVWHDALHEGPVRAGLTLEELTAEREAFWNDREGKLRERDQKMRRLAARDSIWLWFEDDLYDQLQLLQILDLLSAEGLAASVFLIDIPRYVEVPQMAGLAASKVPVAPVMFEVARRAWAAYTSDDPNAIPALLGTDLSPLPHLRPAIERLLEHYPDPASGLNRIERNIVSQLSEGGMPAKDLFANYQKSEERPFLGDLTFFWYLDNLAPLVTKDPRGIYRLNPGERKTPNPRWVGGRLFE